MNFKLLQRPGEGDPIFQIATKIALQTLRYAYLAATCWPALDPLVGPARRRDLRDGAPRPEGRGVVTVNHPRQRGSRRLGDHYRTTELGGHASLHFGHLASAGSTIALARFNAVAAEIARLFARAATALTQISRDRRSLPEDEPR